MGDLAPPDPSRADEQRFRLMTEDPRDIVYFTGTDGRLNWISPSARTVMGWDTEEILGSPVESLLHPDDVKATAGFRQSLRAGVAGAAISAGVSVPLRLMLKDGGHRWISMIATPLLTDDGTPLGVVGRLRDIDELMTTQEALRQHEVLRQAAFDNLLDPLLVMAPVFEDDRIVDFSYVEVNEAACRYNQMTYEQMIGSRLLDIQPGNRETGNFDELLHVFETGEPLIRDSYAYDQELFGGQRRYYDLRVARAGEVLIYTWRDSTGRVEAEQALAEREDLYRLVTEDVADAVVRFDADGVVTWASPSFERLVGVPPDQAIGKSGLQLLARSEVARAEELLRRRVAGEDTGDALVEMTHVDGSVRWVSSHSRPFVRHDGSTDGFVAVLRDVSALVLAERRRDHEVGHDALTGLANRGLAVARIDRVLADQVHPRRFTALLCIGVDRLTTVNQALSYASGDFVLSEVASRITQAVGDPDRVARVAGDEFAVLLADLASPAEAATLAERLCDAARGTIEVGGHVVEPTVSIGVVIAERDSSSEELLRKASLGVRQAKEAGRNRWQFVDPNLAAAAQQQLAIEARLRDALRDGLIDPWFQPVVTLSDRRVCGFEALARWTAPEGNTEPAAFLPVAQSTGLIADVDLTILRQSVDLLAVVDIDHMAVNVSPPSLATGRYVDEFHRILAASGVDATRLRLEVTETALLGLTPSIARGMQAIAATGAAWYVDDFGTGFSSISHLRDLPVRGLKLDRSFTAGIRTGDGTCIKLAQGLVGLARGLGLDTVAEGVETEFEAGALLGQGWNLGQGWLFGRPEARGSIVGYTT
jgi:diguanylate cyclase (GGDEF)-like protein/PAS domain S-box-containing protein